MLFVHDASKANVWLIDFGKTVPTPADTRIDHATPWEVGNHEDGYLIGINNMIDIFADLVAMLEQKQGDEEEQEENGNKAKER